MTLAGIRSCSQKVLGMRLAGTRPHPQEGLGMRLAGTKLHSQGMQLARLFKEQSLELCWQSFSSDFSPSLGHQESSTGSFHSLT